ncbi:MAG: hypothetical protein H6868_01155 [Rhodospirillales bacterium]|nr:hypothetical protein [Rhodospirillales bacterium]
MSGSPSPAIATQGIEYNIYVFDINDDSNKAEEARWHKTDTMKDRAKALSHAEKLANSGKYEKIEVKQKYFDKKKNRDIDITLKTFAHKTQKDFGLILLVLASILCGAGAFALTYLLTKGG